jgi:WD40 repeat protein
MRLLSGYAKPVKAVAVSPDGGRLFSAAEGQSTIWVWDLAAGAVAQKWRDDPARTVHALAVSPCGKWLVAAMEDGMLTAWPLDGGDPVPFERANHETFSPRVNVSIRADSKLVATPWYNYRARSHGVQLWDLAAAKSARRIKGGDEAVDAVLFSPDGGLLAVTTGRVVSLWDYDAAKVIRTFEPPLIPQEIAFRPDGKVLVTGGGHSVFVFDVQTGQLLRTLKGEGNVKGLAYSPDGKYLAVIGLDGVVILRDAATHEVVGQRFLDVGKLHSLAWRHDSAGLIVGGNRPIAVCELDDLLVKQTKPRPRGEPLSLTGHVRRVMGLAYSPDGRSLLSWEGGGFRRWDLSGGAGQAKQVGTFIRPGRHLVNQVTWSPDGRRMALSNGHLCGAETGESVRDLAASPEQFVVRASFTPWGEVFVTAAQAGSIRLILRDSEGVNVRFERVLGPGHGAVSSDLASFGGAASPRLYVSLTGKELSRWTPATGEVVPLAQQKNAWITGLAVSDDERLALTRGGKSVHVWDLAGGSKVRELKHLLEVSGAAFAPHGRLLTACYDGVVRVWDLSSGSELHAFDLGMGKIFSFAVSPDFMTFAAGVEKKNRIVLMDVPE